MGKSITIKLVPTKKDKIYKPLPGYSDLYILMNKLHLNSVNEAITEEEESLQVSELELQKHQTQEALNNNYKEESTLNVLMSCLETVNESIKKLRLQGKKASFTNEHIKDFNKILEESELKLKDKLKLLNIDEFKDDLDTFIQYLKENMKLISDRKAQIINNNNHLNAFISKLDTLKENINSSTTDIDSVEVALRNLNIK